MRVAIFLMALLAATALARGEPGGDIPAGDRVVFSADTLANLAKQAKPQIQDDDWFIWTAKDDQGQRTFTIAQAAPVMRGGKVVQWEILEGVQADIPDDPLVRTTLALQAARPQHDEPHGLESYAVMASRDNKRGTVYEIGIVYGPAGMGRYETEIRHFVMHDPQHGWRYLGRCQGAARGGLGGGCGFETTATTFVDWTNDDPPARLVVTREVTDWWQWNAAEDDLQSRWLSRSEQEIPLCGGSQEPVVGCRTFTVEADDTLKSIAERLAMFSDLDHKTTNVGLMLQAIRALNPNVDKLAVGQRLYVPSITEEMALLKGTSKPAQLPLSPRYDLTTMTAPTREEAVCAAMLVNHVQMEEDKVDWPATLQLVWASKAGEFVDLNGDGKLDWAGRIDIYKPVGQATIVSGGSNADWAIIAAVSTGYRVVGSGYGAGPMVLGTWHNGWREIEVGEHTGGIEKGANPHWTLRYDGNMYR